MKKLKLLVASSLLFGGALVSFSFNNGNAITANAAEVGENYSISDAAATSIVDGGQYVIRTLNAEYKDNYVYMTNNNGNYFNYSDDSTAAYVFTFELDEVEQKYVISFETENGTMYLESGTGKNYLKESDQVNVNTYWNVDFSGDSVIIESRYNRTIQFNANKGQERFATYTSNQKPISLFAVQENNITEYNVNLHYGIDNTEIETISVKENDLIEFIDSTKFDVDNYILEGWYISQNFEKNTLFDFSSPVTSDLDLYAKYVELTDANYFESQKTSASLKLGGSHIVNGKDYAIDLNACDVPSSDGKNLSTIDNLSEYFFGENANDWIVKYTDGSTPTRMWNDSTLRIYKEGSVTFENKNQTFNSIKLDFDKGEPEAKITDEFGNSPKEINGVYVFTQPTHKVTISATATVQLQNMISFIGKTETYDITSAGLRFGTNIPVENFDETAEYGVIAVTKLNGYDSYIGLDSMSMNDWYEAGMTKDEYLSTLKEFVPVYDTGFIEAGYVAEPNATEAVENIDEAKYAQYALVLTGLEDLLDEEFAAVCYMVTADGEFHIMKETRYSVKSIAEAYLANDEIMSTLTENSIALLNAIVA